MTRIVIEINEKTDAALARRQSAEGLNPTTLFNRAMQVYDMVMWLQETGEPVIVNGQELTLE